MATDPAPGDRVGDRFVIRVTASRVIWRSKVDPNTKGSTKREAWSKWAARRLIRLSADNLEFPVRAGTSWLCPDLTLNRINQKASRIALDLVDIRAIRFPLSLHHSPFVFTEWARIFRHGQARDLTGKGSAARSWERWKSALKTYGVPHETVKMPPSLVEFEVGIQFLPAVDGWVASALPAIDHSEERYSKSIEKLDRARLAEWRRSQGNLNQVG